jgi:2-dehydropantoate 2-reductase
VINNSGIPCRYTDNIFSYLWDKLLYNCALNPLGAVMGVEYGKLGENRSARLVMDAIIEECFEVAFAIKKLALPAPMRKILSNDFNG